MCEECKHREEDPNKDPKCPCNYCIYWDIDGYLEYREFERIST